MKILKKAISAVSVLALMSTVTACPLSAFAVESSTTGLAMGALQDTRTPVSDSGSDMPKATNVASSVDLSKDSAFPPVRSQGSVGSCASWATTYYQFGYQVAKLNSWNAKSSTYYQFSPKFTYNIVNGGENKGSYVESNYEILKLHGAVRYSQFTPTGKASDVTEYLSWCTNTTALENALKYRVSDYEYLNFAGTSVSTPITSANSSCLKTMKAFLSLGHILTYTTDFGEWDYEKLSSQYSSSLNNQYVCIKQSDDNGEWDGHCMAIVGYDDNITYDLNGDGKIQSYERGAFKVVNSWGTDWKNNGFVWVMYDALNQKSNASNQNVSGRRAIFDNYAYNVISVEACQPNLIAEVTINSKARNALQLKLGNSVLTKSTPASTISTMLNNNGGAFNFNGVSGTYASGTLAFDYADLCEADTVRKNYYLKFSNNSSVLNKISKIKLIDNTGKTVVSDSTVSNLYQGTVTRKYAIGMVGDVNNNGILSTDDVTLIQKYLASTVTLSGSDLLVADVDGNGNIDVNDVTQLQKKIANLSELPAGHFVRLT